MFPYRLQTYIVVNMFTSFTISHIHKSIYQSLVSVPQKCTLISNSPSSKKVRNLHIVLVFLTPFLILLFSLVLSCHLHLLVYLYHLLLILLVSCFSMCHHSAQLHFLLKSPFHSLPLIFLSRGLHLLQFSRCDFCVACMFFHSQSSEYNSLHLLFLLLLHVSIFHLLTFSVLPQILTPSFPLCVDHNSCFVSPYLSFSFL